MTVEEAEALSAVPGRKRRQMRDITENGSRRRETLMRWPLEVAAAAIVFESPVMLQALPEPPP
jgi:hypothetical protein